MNYGLSAICPSKGQHSAGLADSGHGPTAKLSGGGPAAPGSCPGLPGTGEEEGEADSMMEVKGRNQA